MFNFAKKRILFIVMLYGSVRDPPPSSYSDMTFVMSQMKLNFGALLIIKINNKYSVKIINIF